MRKILMDTYFKELTRALGRPRQDVEQAQLEALFKAEDYRGLIAAVKKSFQLNMRLQVAWVNSGGNEEDDVWLKRPALIPAYGTPAFADSEFVLYIRRTFLKLANFEILTVTVARTMSSIVLHSIDNEFAGDRAAADVTAMILGYTEFLKRSVDVKMLPASSLWPKTLNFLLLESRDLSEEEIIYVAGLIKTARVQ